MAQITITIRGRSYDIACDDGQEEHLTRLAQLLDRRAAQLVNAVGHINENLLLAMVALVVADELHDARAEIAELRETRRGGVPADATIADAELAERIDTLTERVEALAGNVE